MENEYLKKELEKYAATTSVLFSRFRVLFYSSVINKMFTELLDKKTPANINFKLNANNVLHVIPTADKVTLIFGIHFLQKTDVALAKVFLQEIEDSKRHVKNSVEVKYYPDAARPPLELKSIETDPGKYSNGFVVFSKKFSNI